MLKFLIWLFTAESRFLPDDSNDFNDKLDDTPASSNPNPISSDNVKKSAEPVAQKQPNLTENAAATTTLPPASETKEKSTSETDKRANPNIKELLAEKRELEIRNDELSKLIKERSNISTHLENISEILAKKNYTSADIKSHREKEKTVLSTDTSQAKPNMDSNINNSSNNGNNSNSNSNTNNGNSNNSSDTTNDKSEIKDNNENKEEKEQRQESKKTPEDKTKEHELKHLEDLESLRKEARSTILDKIKINLRLRRLRNAIFEILREKNKENIAEISETKNND